jgi:hypothetical protein
VDTAPPVSAVQGLFRTRDGVHYLTWRGTDTGSGVAAYTVQARDGTTGEWQDLWTDTPLTSGIVQVAPGVTRYFRVHARDALGHAESPHSGDGDLDSGQVTLLSYNWYYAELPKGVAQTAGPTRTPSPTPTATPTAVPTPVPTAVPTAGPTPTATPTPLPTAVVTPTAVPAPLPTVPTLVPTATRLPSPTPRGGLLNLPDLQVTRLLSNQAVPTDCDKPAGILVEVSNQGSAPAGRFTVRLAGAGLQGCRWEVDGLAPGVSAGLLCPAIVLNTVVTATVDLENWLGETNEGNNTLAAPVSVVVVAPCTPRPNP